MAINIACLYSLRGIMSTTSPDIEKTIVCYGKVRKGMKRGELPCGRGVVGTVLSIKDGKSGEYYSHRGIVKSI